MHQPPPLPVFQGYPSFLATFLVPLQVTQFLEGPIPLHFNEGVGGSNYVKVLHVQ